MRTLNAAPPRRLGAPRPKLLRPQPVRSLDARTDRRLTSPHPTRLPRAGGAFLPGFAGLAEDLNDCEVQVGYMDPAVSSMIRGGVGALDLQSLLTTRNVLIAGGVALVASTFLFKRKRK